MNKNVVGGKRDWWRTQTEFTIKRFRTKLLNLLEVKTPDKPKFLEMITLEDETVDDIMKEIGRLERFEKIFYEAD